VAAQQDPGMAQDAEAAREKLLRAADQLDMIQSNSEANKTAIGAMRTDIARLQSDNADLKQQLAALQAALDKEEADRAKERQILVNEVAALVASKTSDSHPAPKHHEVTASDSDAAPSAEVHIAGETSPATATHTHHPLADNDIDPTDAGSADPAPAPAPKPQKGYYHIVDKGETLSMICAAYADQGVKVTVAQVRKANGLTTKSVLKVGQKLFIPKPND
jgi:LysM repeat protein